MNTKTQISQQVRNNLNSIRGSTDSLKNNLITNLRWQELHIRVPGQQYQLQRSQKMR